MVFLTALAAALAVVSPSPSPSALPQIAHVTTSDRTNETLHNSVRTTYLVTANDIARNGYRTVSDAIANVPGVQIAGYGTIGAAAQYGIRGSASTEVLVLIDGVPAAGGLADSVELGSMSTAGVARIEIVEGGGSTLYGTGAIGGIINIITNDHNTAPNAMLRYGSFDDAELQVGAAGFNFDRTVANNAYSLPESVGSSGPNPTTRNNSDYEATAARYGTSRTIGALDLSFHAGAESDDLGAAGIFPDYSSTSREHDVNEGATLNLSLPKPQSNATLSLFGSTQQVTFDCDIADAAFCTLNTETRDGLSLRDVINGSDERTIYGIDLSRGTARGDGGGGDFSEDALAQSAAYAQQTWLGVRDEYYVGIRGERDGSLGGEFSPSAGARFDLSPATTLSFNAATAFRAPNATELYFPGYGSVAQGLGLLQPERAQTGDITLADQRFLGGTSLGWFDNYTRDLIVATCIANCNPATAPPNTFPDYAPQNVDRAHIAGFTFDTRTRAIDGLSATLNATNLYLAQDLTAQTRLPDDPVFTVALGLTFTGDPQSFVSEAGISERAVGPRTGEVGPIDPTQPLFFQPVAYSSLTAYASFRVAQHALLTLRGFNLGNERYAEVAGYPMPGRTFAVELRSR